MGAPGSRLPRPARGAVLPSIVPVLLVALLSGCGQRLVEGKVGVEATRNGTSTVVVRITGTAGVDYAGSYGLLGAEQERLTGTVGAEPTTYEVPVRENGPAYEYVNANFMKLVPKGCLRVELLSDGRVVLGKTTRAYEGVITLNYTPPDGRENASAGPAASTFVKGGDHAWTRS